MTRVRTSSPTKRKALRKVLGRKAKLPAPPNRQLPQKPAQGHAALPVTQHPVDHAWAKGLPVPKLPVRNFKAGVLAGTFVYPLLYVGTSLLNRQNVLSLIAINTLNRKRCAARIAGFFARAEAAMLFPFQIAICYIEDTKEWCLVDSQNKLYGLLRMPESYQISTHLLAFRVKTEADYLQLFSLFDSFGKKRDTADQCTVMAKVLELPTTSGYIWSRIAGAIIGYLGFNGSHKNEDWGDQVLRAEMLRQHPVERDLLYRVFHLEQSSLAENEGGSKLRRHIIQRAFLEAYYGSEGRKGEPVKARQFFSTLLSGQPTKAHDDRLPLLCRKMVLDVTAAHGKSRKLRTRWLGGPVEILETVQVWWSAFRDGRHTFVIHQPPFMSKQRQRQRVWSPGNKA